MFGGKARSLLNVEQMKGAFFRLAPALLANIRLGK